jgi:hypothetical protein
MLTAEDFTGSLTRGTFLTPAALKRYFAAYEKEVSSAVALDGEAVSFLQLFRRQAERLARSLVDGAAYRGFQLPC